MNYYVNKNVKNTKRIFPMQGRYGYKRYDMNENPEGLPDDFVNSVLREITPEFLSTYPEPDKFINQYADYIGVNYENVVATNGSDMAIRYLLETFCEPGKEVVTVSPTFEMYGVNCSILGLKHIPVRYEDNLTVNMDKIISTISYNTDIIVLLNPNNPIGNVYTEDELNKVIKKAKDVGALVIIDEAYHYFYEKTFIGYTLSEQNVVILRTFSKLFSLAACRLGVIISNPQIIQYIKNIKLTFDVNSIALLFGEKILGRPDIITHLIQEEVEGKHYILTCLRDHGYQCRDCNGNFILVKPKSDATILSKKLQAEKKILVHSYGDPLLKEYLRISVGSKKAMEPFLTVFLELDQA